MAKILVADDDVILAELLRFRLESAGHDVMVAADGRSAMEQTWRAKPDLIVLDSMMPELTGPEVLFMLKDDSALARIPVVMLTARRAKSDIVAALKSGVDEYITKPFIPQELLMHIDRLLAEAA